MHTFFVTFLNTGTDQADQADWAEVHADTIGQVAEVADNHGWRIMSIHDTACWRRKLRVETRNQLEILELDRFLHYHRRPGREDATWLDFIRGRAEALRRSVMPR